MMRRKSGRNSRDRRYRTAMATLLASGLVTQVAHATPDNWQVDGEHGQLYVHGMVNEGACHLDMTSVFQDIAMGSLTTEGLEHPGDEGAPLPFTLHLKGCIRTRGDSTERRTGVQTWSAVQPVVTVSFQAPTVPASPDLIAVAGMPGLGLRIEDSQGRSVRPGDRSVPQFVTPGDNQLTYTLTPVRTAAILAPGTWHAVVNFALSYD